MEKIPADIKAMLKASYKKSPKMPTDLAIEWGDPRTINDVVFQFLAVKRPGALQAHGVRKLYFTCQFYNFQPCVTEQSRLQDCTPSCPSVQSLQPLSGRVRSVD